MHLRLSLVTYSNQVQRGSYAPSMVQVHVTHCCHASCQAQLQASAGPNTQCDPGACSPNRIEQKLQRKALDLEQMIRALELHSVPSTAQQMYAVPGFQQLPRD